MTRLEPPLLRASYSCAGARFGWCVLTMGKNYYVLPFRSFLEKIAVTKRQAATLATVFGLENLVPSHVLQGRAKSIELAKRPRGKSTESYVVLTSKRKERIAIAGVGVVGKPVSISFKRRRWVSAGGAVRGPGGVGGDTGSGAGGRWAVKAAAKRPAKKAAPSGRGPSQRQRGRGVLSFGGYEPKGRASKEPERNLTAQVLDTVNVFYATDREPKESGRDGSTVGYSNRLAPVSKLAYGLCTVSIPENHKTGRLEAPSIWRFQIHEDPKKHFSLQECSSRTPAAFFKELSQLIAKGEKKTAFVFIHGYNVSFDAAVKRTAQLSRDMRFPGAPILYSWASAAAKRLYSKDEETVALTADRLAAFLKRLSETSGATEIHLIAHSMGNRALINALKEFQTPSAAAKPFKQVVLTAPDVPRQDAEVLIAAANANAERITLYASSKDRALLLSRGLHDNRRLGYVYDYPYVIPGLDSIDASSVETDLLGHSFFAATRTVLGDLSALVLEGKEPGTRFGLRKLKTPSGLCWEFH
jgi:esterase/lipase superfamily enzyme